MRGRSYANSLASAVLWATSQCSCMAGCDAPSNYHAQGCLLKETSCLHCHMLYHADSIEPKMRQFNYTLRPTLRDKPDPLPEQRPSRRVLPLCGTLIASALRIRNPKTNTHKPILTLMVNLVHKNLPTSSLCKCMDYISMYIFVFYIYTYFSLSLSIYIYNVSMQRARACHFVLLCSLSALPWFAFPVAPHGVHTIGGLTSAGKCSTY